MGLFKKGAEEPLQEAREKPAAGLTLTRMNLLPVVAAVVVMAATGVAAYTQFASEVTGSQRDRHVANADRLAAHLSGRVAALGERVSAVAQADELLLEAATAGDAEGLRQREQAVASLFPESVRVRIILPADVEPDNSVTPPVGYACLDLVRQAETGKVPPLEMHLFGSEEAHLDLIRPLRGREGAIASLMVSLPPAQVKQWLASMNPGDSYIELQQGAEGPTLATAGSAQFKAGQPLTSVGIEGSSWQLAYWMGDGIGVAEAQKVGFIATFAVAALVLALLLLLFGARLSKRLRQELAAMVDFIIDSSRGKRIHSYPVKLVELEQALHALEPVFARAQNQDAITEKAEKGDNGMPDLMFADFGELTVEEEPAAEGEQADATDTGTQEKP